MSRLGDILLGENLRTPNELSEALGKQLSDGERKRSCLLRLGHILEARLSAEDRVESSLPEINPVQMKSSNRSQICWGTSFFSSAGP